MGRLRKFGLFCLVWILSSLAGTVVVLAQVPAHQPGTICFTPNFWCWAQPPGVPEAPCSCPTTGGYVQGVLG